MDLSKQNVCLAPWINLHIQTTGEIKPCCAAKEPFEKIQEGWNYTQYSTNKALINLKQAQINNKPPEYCSGCSEKDWYEEFRKNSIHINNIEECPVQSVDARWSNVCNLTCTYCSKNYSSSWDALEGQNSKSKKYPNEIDSLFVFFEKNLANIKRVSLVGGEPLLMKENARLLKLLPLDVKIDIITNLSVDLKNNQVHRLLLERPMVSWNISMETLGDKFEFVRRGAFWDRQLENLQQLAIDTSDTTHSRYLLSTYCAYSATNLVELYEFASSKNLKIKLSTLSDPEVLNFFKWPDVIKEVSLSQIDTIMKNSDAYKLSLDQIENLNGIKEKLISSFGQTQVKIIEDCIAWHQTRETRYFDNAKDFLTLWPQYAEFTS
jgi:molybdenum cofactor biosynthesis enzyme MoaA